MVFELFAYSSHDLIPFHFQINRDKLHLPNVCFLVHRNFYAAMCAFMQCAWKCFIICVIGSHKALCTGHSLKSRYSSKYLAMLVGAIYCYGYRC